VRSGFAWVSERERPGVVVVLNNVGDANLDVT
jgi:hypothetical protein